MEKAWSRFAEDGYDSKRFSECVPIFLCMLATAWYVGPLWYLLVIFATRAALGRFFDGRWSGSPNRAKKEACLSLAWPMLAVLIVPIVRTEEALRAERIIRSVMEETDEAV